MLTNQSDYRSNSDSSAWQHRNLTFPGQQKSREVRKYSQIPPSKLGDGSSNPYRHFDISFYSHCKNGREKTQEPLRFLGFWGTYLFCTPMVIRVVITDLIKLQAGADRTYSFIFSWHIRFLPFYVLQCKRRRSIYHESKEKIPVFDRSRMADTYPRIEQDAQQPDCAGGIHRSR